jgi:hypothetical protein
VYQHDRRQNEYDIVGLDVLEKAPNGMAQNFLKAALLNAVAQRDAAHREEYNRPRELLKVVLYINMKHLFRYLCTFELNM